jgi:hypothetical protein
MDANQLFAAKWPSVEREVRRRAERIRIGASDVDDLVQLAGLTLWQQCQRLAETDGGERISRTVIALCAWNRWQRDHLPATFTSLDAENRDGDTWTDNLPARVTEVRVDGVTLTPADAEMDAPTACAAARDGVPLSEVAARLGISTQAVRVRAAELGGVRVGGRWVFPAETGVQ